MGTKFDDDEERRRKQQQERLKAQEDARKADQAEAARQAANLRMQKNAMHSEERISDENDNTAHFAPKAIDKKTHQVTSGGQINDNFSGYIDYNEAAKHVTADQVQAAHETLSDILGSSHSSKKYKAYFGDSYIDTQKQSMHSEDTAFLAKDNPADTSLQAAYDSAVKSLKSKKELSMNGEGNAYNLMSWDNPTTQTSMKGAYNPFKDQNGSLEDYYADQYKQAQQNYNYVPNGLQNAIASVSPFVNPVTGQKQATDQDVFAATQARMNSSPEDQYAYQVANRRNDSTGWQTGQLSDADKAELQRYQNAIDAASKDKNAPTLNPYETYRYHNLVYGSLTDAQRKAVDNYQTAYDEYQGAQSDLKNGASDADAEANYASIGLTSNRKDNATLRANVVSAKQKVEQARNSMRAAGLTDEQINKFVGSDDTDKTYKNSYLGYNRSYKDYLDTQDEAKQVTGRNDAWGLYNRAASAVVSSAASPITNIGSFINSLGAKSADPGTSKNVYGNKLNNAMDAYRAGTSAYMNKTYGKAGEFLYNAAQSAGDSFVNGMIMGPVANKVSGAAGKALGNGTKAAYVVDKLSNLVGSSAFGAGAYADRIREGQERGQSAAGTQAAAVGAGLAEMVTEAWSLDSFTDILTKKGAAAMRNTLSNILVQAGVEGSEEAAGDIMNRVIDDAANGKNSEYKQAVSAYQKQGMTEKQAKKKANIDFLSDTLQDALAGALSGGVLGGGAHVMNNMQTAQQAQTETAGYTSEDFRNTAESYKKAAEGMTDTGAQKYYSDAAKAANDIADRMDSGKKVRSSLYSKLYNSAYEAEGIESETRKPAEETKQEITPDDQVRFNVPEGAKTVEEALNSGESAQDKVNSMDRIFARKYNDMSAGNVHAAMQSAQTAQELVNAKRQADLSTNAAARDISDAYYNLYQGRMIQNGQATAEDFQKAESSPTMQEVYQAAKEGHALNISESDPMDLRMAQNAGKQANILLNSNSVLEDQDLSNVQIHPATQKSEAYATIDGKDYSLDSLNDTIQNRALRVRVAGASQQSTQELADLYLKDAPQGMREGRWNTTFSTLETGGSTGRNFDEAYKAIGGSAAMVDADTARQIYNAGAAAAQAQISENVKRSGQSVARYGTGSVIDSRKNSKEALPYMPVVEAMAEATGVDFYLSDDAPSNINGTFDRAMSRVMINTNNSDAVLNTLFHEGMGEYMQAYNPEGYKSVQKLVSDYLVDTDGLKNVAAIGKKYQRAYQNVEGAKSFYDALSEATNDSIAGMFSTDEGIKQFTDWTYKHDSSPKSALQNVADYFKKIGDAFHNLLTTGRLSGASKRTARMGEERANHVRQVILDEMDKAIENSKNATIDESIKSKANYSIDTASGETGHSISFAGETYDISEDGKTATDENGNKIAVVDNSLFNVDDFSNWSDLAGALSKWMKENLKGKSVYIPAGDETIYFSRRSYGEYTHSTTAKHDYKAAPTEYKSARANALSDITTIIEGAQNPRHENPTSEPKAFDWRGYMRYDVKYLYNNDGQYLLFNGNLVAAQHENGRDYFYDITYPRLTNEAGERLGASEDTDGVREFAHQPLSGSSVSQSDKNGTKISDLRRSLNDIGDDDFFSSMGTEENPDDPDVKHRHELMSEAEKALSDVHVDDKYLKVTAKGIIDSFGSSYDSKTLAENLRKVFSYAKTHEGFMGSSDYEGIMDDVLRPVMEASEQTDDTQLRQVKEIMSQHPFHLTEDQMDMVKDDYRGWKAQYPELKVSKSAPSTLDQQFSEIADQFRQAGIADLDESAGETDQLTELLDAIDSAQPVSLYAFSNEEDAQQAVKDMADTVMTSYLSAAEADAQGQALVRIRTARDRIIDSGKERRKKASQDYQARLSAARKDIAKSNRSFKGQGLSNDENIKRLTSAAESLEAQAKELRSQALSSDAKIDRAKLASLSAKEKASADKAALMQRMRGQRAAALERQAQQYRQTVARLKTQYHSKAEQLALTKAKNAEKWKNYREKQARNAELEKITKSYDSLYKQLMHPTDEKHIPEEFKSAVAEFLDSINMIRPDIRYDNKSGVYRLRIWDGTFEKDGKAHYTESGYSTYNEAYQAFYRYVFEDNGTLSSKNATIRAKMQGVRDLYEQATKDEDGETGNISQLLDPDLYERLKTLSSRNVAALSSDELHTISLAMQNIQHAVSNENELFRQSQSPKMIYESIRDHADSIHGRQSHRPGTDKLLDFLSLDNATPETVFHGLGKGGDSVFKEFVKANNMKSRDLRTAQEYMIGDGSTDHGVYKSGALKGVSQKQLQEWSTKSITVHGNIQMTYGQIMGLYELAKRQQAMLHTVGGISIDNFLDEHHKKVTQGRVYLSAPEIQAIVDGNLTTQQKQVADAMQRFMAQVCSSWGNEASMLMYGYKKFNEENYYPITVDKKVLSTKNADVAQSAVNSIKNMGMTKAVVPNASNPLVVKDIFDVYTNHVADMATYHSYAAPLADLLRVLNYKEVVEQGGYKNYDTVKDAIAKIYGDGGTRYIEKFITDINGRERSNYINPFSRLTGNYKAAAVGWNGRVVFQQPMAVFRAADVISPKYLMEGQILNKDAMEMQERTSDMTWEKKQGNVDGYIYKSMKQTLTGAATPVEKLRDASMSLAGKADDFTWRRIYNAAYLEQRDKFRKEGKQTSGKAFEDAVNDRFDEIIVRTQVTDATILRSQFMRSNDKLNGIQSAFMAEPTKSYNMFLRAAMDAVQQSNGKWITGKALWGMKKAAAVFFVTQIFTALAQSAVDWIRKDPDEGENVVDYMWRVYKGNFWDDMNPLNLIPIFKDVSGIAESVVATFRGEQTYSDDSRMDLATLNTLAKALENGVRLGVGKGTVYGLTYSGVKAFSQLSGIPMSNLMRDAVALRNKLNNIQSVHDLIGDDWSTVQPSQKEKVLNAYKYGELGDLASGIVDSKTTDALAENADDIKDGSIEKSAVEKQAKSEALSTILNSFKKEYQAADDATRKEMKDKLTSQLKDAGFSEEAIDEKLGNWTDVKLKKDANGYKNIDPVTGEKTSVGDVFKTIRTGNGDYKKEIEKAVKAGMDYKKIETDITSTFKAQYLADYQKSPSSVSQLKNRLTAVYQYLDDQEIKEGTQQKETTSRQWLDDPAAYLKSH